jgi:hypothetical protein
MLQSYIDNSYCTFPSFEEDHGTITSTTIYCLTSTTNQTGQAFGFALPPIYCISIDSVTSDKKKICWSQPIIAVVGYQNKLYAMENKDLGIIVMSADYDKCCQDFKDELLFILNAYGKEKDENLTSDAKELKKRILQYLIK